MPELSIGVYLAAAWAAGAAWMLALAFRTRALGSRLMDHPDARKHHAAPVPRVGGLAIAGALAATALLLLSGGPLDAVWLPFLVLAGGATVIGAADDLGRLSTSEKLAAQVALSGVAGVWLEWSGHGAGAFGDLTFGWLSPLMTALWVFAVITVVNFIDGIDGITAFVCVCMLSVGVGCGAGPGDGTLYLLAAAALLGVAFWNVTPARVFLGDAGSHLLGLLVAVLPLGVRGAPEAVSSVPWPLAAAPLLPCVIDVGWGVAAKVRHGIPVHAAHSDHVYQRITKAGASHLASAARYGLLTLTGVALACASGSLGLAMTLGLAALVLGVHFGTAWRRTRDVPLSFPPSGEVSGTGRRPEAAGRR
jgi:UDP-N-acetylmuramyl pentapeptide phosphotransferase/UDP-N-acetylglucosamine-1-phosphate transferase